jgi:hypothetical protein
MMEISELLAKQSYTNKDINYLYSTFLYEYDVKAANINCLLAAGRIDKSLYTYLSNSTKQFREVYIGNMVKNDVSIYKDIQKVLIEAKRFLIENYTNPNNVIRIANDAIFFFSPISTLPDKYVYMYNGVPITFVRKNIYTSYMRFDRILVFMNTLGENFQVDVKGISDDQLPLHEKFLTIICECVQAKESGGSKIALTIFNNYYSKFIKRELDIDYYRQFNANSDYKLASTFGDYTFQYPSPGVNVNTLDINCNLNILRKLYSYLLS